MPSLARSPHPLSLTSLTNAAGCAKSWRMALRTCGAWFVGEISLFGDRVIGVLFGRLLGLGIWRFFIIATGFPEHRSRRWESCNYLFGSDDTIEERFYFDEKLIVALCSGCYVFRTCLGILRKKEVGRVDPKASFWVWVWGTINVPNDLVLISTTGKWKFVCLIDLRVFRRLSYS